MKTSMNLKNKELELNESTMKELIIQSGYLLEKRVATLLRNSGYKVVPNRGFKDVDTNKSREYDVYAYKDIEVYGTGSYGIYPTLVCECKNYSLPVVFFVQEKRDFKPLQDEVRVSGIPSKIWRRNKYISMQEFVNVLDFHHYCKPEVPVATQYCEFNKKKDSSGWVPCHSEESHETIRTLTKALEQEIEDDFRNMNQWLMPEEIEKEFIDLSFYYPVLVLQGDIYAAYIEDNNLSGNNNLTFDKCQHIQYNSEFFSFYDNEVISYHIDVISEKYLPFYLKLIDREMLKIKEVLQQQKQNVMCSIDKIITECRSIENKPKTYRKYLEYEF